MKDISRHSMQSEKASRIKNRGHNKEYLLASLINAEVIKGTNKIDLKDNFGKTYTVKGGSEVKGSEGRDGRWQLFMFKKSRFEKEEIFPGKELLIEILDVFPKDIEEYKNNDDYYKQKVRPYMVQLKEYFQNEKDLMKKFLDKSIFNLEIDFLAIYHDEVFHIFLRDDVLKIFEENIHMRNSEGEQKVIFTYDDKILIELEVRKSKGKYPSILLVTNKMKILNLLQNHLTENKLFNRNLSVYGNAIENFKL